MASTKKKSNISKEKAIETINQWNMQAIPGKIVFTKPPEPCKNNLLDNVNDDLVVSRGDVFVSELGVRYIVKDMLGHGTFGQVFECSVDETGEVVAVKVIKNQPAYYHQARVEIGILQFLNTRADPGDCFHIVRLKDFFIHSGHLCLVFELLGLNLFELIKHNKFKGLSLALIRVFMTQILEALVILHNASIIHCDLKPENILLTSSASGAIKIIDFGSACFSNRTVYSYIQSRFYRSPEVILGYPYSTAVDMWSIGCVAAELFLGLPLFPASSEYDLINRIIETLGSIPESVLRKGKFAGKYFSTTVINSKISVRLRTREEFEYETGQNAAKGKQYFMHKALADIINAYPFKSNLSEEDHARERHQRECFTDFILGLLDLDPNNRWSPRQALTHPFITGGTFDGPFQPQPESVQDEPMLNAGIKVRNFYQMQSNTRFSTTLVQNEGCLEIFPNSENSNAPISSFEPINGTQSNKLRNFTNITLKCMKEDGNLERFPTMETQINPEITSKENESSLDLETKQTYGAIESKCDMTLSIQEETQTSCAEWDPGWR